MKSNNIGSLKRFSSAR